MTYTPGVSGLTINVTVSAVAPGAGTPSGTVTFKAGGKVLGTATLSGGTASMTSSIVPKAGTTLRWSIAGMRTSSLAV